MPMTQTSFQEAVQWAGGLMLDLVTHTQTWVLFHCVGSTWHVLKAFYNTLNTGYNPHSNDKMHIT